MKYPLWKPLLILTVVAFCGSMIAVKGLKPGIDLAGGTTLVYDVLVPQGTDAERVIDETIAIQRERVDPLGQKNLVWRPEAGNRISVTMAQAGPVVKERAEAYDQARAALLTHALDPVALDSALKLADAQARTAAFTRLVGDDAPTQERLEALTALSAQRDQLYAQYQEAEETLAALAAGNDTTLDEEARLALAAAEERRDTVAAEFLQVRDAYEAQRSAVLTNAISPTEVDRVLSLSTELKLGQTAADTARAKGFADLKDKYPSHAQTIDTLQEKLLAYEQVKGPLDDPNDLIRMLRGAGVLEFRIAARPAGPRGAAEPASISAFVNRLEEKGPRAGLTEAWRWFEVQDFAQFVERENIRTELQNDPKRIPAYFASNYNLVAQPYGGSVYVLLSNQPGTAMTGNDDWTLTSTYTTPDQLGRPSVGFALDGKGAGLMAELTGPNVGRNMAIVLDGKLMSAPNLNDQLSTGGVITGEFSQTELQYLLRTLGAGSLEGQLSYDPISIKTTGPALGQDNLKQGLRACFTALAIVALFMAVYYLFAGLVADFALIANMVIILGVMSLIEATFTLPGIAGLVLTIGMAVDANVLIFERIREELENKADLPTAVRLGFSKAFSTIIDANITTLITCVVLGYTASAEVKGFAVVLGIGILATLFTALFSSRVIIDLYVRLRRPRTLAMLPTLVPAVRRLFSPNVNWIGLRPLFLPISAGLMIAGTSMVVYRGSDLLDIEFRSGTEVTFELAAGKSLPLDDVRQRLEGFASSPQAQEINDEIAAAVERATRRSGEGIVADDIVVPQTVDWTHLADAQIVTVGESLENGNARGFSVATLIENSSAVSEAIRQSFREELDTTEALDFTGAGLSVDEAKGIVEPITSASLYANLGRSFPEADADLQAFLGGVVIKLDQVDPAVSLEDADQRISRMRRQPEYELLGSRPYQVFGLERVGSNVAGQATYSAFAVAVRDPDTNYAEDRSAFSDAAGLAATEWKLVQDALQRDTSLASVSNFSSQVSGTMKQQAIVALVLSLLAVVAYIWLRFGSLRYGLAAIVALLHDVSITLGILAICGYLVGIPGFHQALLLDDFKINLALVAALLTIVGYSLNDTIVVFDRIRENRGRLSRATPAIINQSINQTISRTILTSGTTLLAVFVLYILGGPGVHGFAFAMLIGILVGTYSSIAIAAPILLIGEKKSRLAAEADRTTPTTPGSPARV